ncbi:MAG: recombinase RecA [Candidatus Rokubacteria bacterium]|nr:recombinase RecA [Candidatus Rokubacteria bacterium]
MAKETENTRKQALDLAIQQIERQFGKGAVMRLGAKGPLEEIAVVPTGALSLDVALGVGGVPRGRVVEIFGPESSGKTTLALHIIAEAQRLGGIAAFIDAEHALDPIYAKRLGVNTDELLIAQPDTGEQALEIGEGLVRSNAVDVIVVDSVAALVPRAELDGDMGDSLPGLQARLMSQALRKLTAAISRSGVVMIFINQIREKIGVMFGCLHHETRVLLADGTRVPIGRLVRERRNVEVLSFDPNTGQVVPRRIVNWFDNGVTDHFLQFEVRGGPARRRCFAATPNHIVFTPNGEVPAGELNVGDEVLFSMPDYQLTDSQQQLVLGGTLGDGSLRAVGQHSAHFRVAHSVAQKDYLEWKHRMLEPFSRPIGRVGNGIGFSTLTMPVLGALRRELYDVAGGRAVAPAALDRLDARGLAVWYGDDGSFMGSYERWGKGKAVLYNKALTGEARAAVLMMLRRFGFDSVRDDGRGFWFRAEDTLRFHELIAPYLHPAVDYKLHPSLRGRFTWHADSTETLSLAARRCQTIVPVRIEKRYHKPRDRYAHRYDLEVGGSHTYLADGVVVHNSPETTSGGRALKFYASVRLDVRRIDTIKQGTEAVGVRTKVKVVKNKLAPPFREAEFDMIYGEGISKAATILDAGVEQNLIEKSGTWYTFKNERIGQGRENAKKWLQENPVTLADLEMKIRETLGLRAPTSLK